MTVATRLELTKDVLDGLGRMRPSLSSYLAGAGWAGRSVPCNLFPNGRCVISFPGLSLDEHSTDVAFELDRQLDVDDACVVLDQHPLDGDVNVRLNRGDLVVGNAVTVSARTAQMHLVKAAPDENRRVSCRVVRREAFMVELEAPCGKRFTADVDELTTWGG